MLLRHPNYYKTFYFFSPSIRTSEKNINFENKKIKKSDFYKNKKVFKADEIHVDKILVSKKESHGTNKSIRYFFVYNDGVIRPLCIKLSQVIGYIKYFDSNKSMLFKVTDKKLSKNYTKIWGKVSNLIDIKFHSQPIYGDNDKYIKTEIQICREKLNTQKKKIHHTNVCH